MARSAHATSPHVAVVQCQDTFEQDWFRSHGSSQALVGLAGLLGVRYDTITLRELVAKPAGQYSSLWFSACPWITDDTYDSFVAQLTAHLVAGGTVFIEGPIGILSVDSGGNESFRGMDAVSVVLGIDDGGYRSATGFIVETSAATHPIATRAGYGVGAQLSLPLVEGTDTLELTGGGSVLLELVSPADGTTFPFLVVTEPSAGARVAMIGSYSDFLGLAVPFRDEPVPAFMDTQVLPYLLETLVWTLAEDDQPYAGLQLSHAPMTMIGRLDGDWSDVDFATSATLDYLNNLGEKTGVATVYGIVSSFAEAEDVWPEFRSGGELLQDLGGTIGSHSRVHNDNMSDELDPAGWDVEVAGSLQEISLALSDGSFVPDAYAFINPGNTIQSRDYGEFFADIDLFMSHGFSAAAPYLSGVQGFDLPDGVSPIPVINTVVASDYGWLYSADSVFTVSEAAAFQQQILDHYQNTVGHGVLYNQMWHDYAIGGDEPLTNDPPGTDTSPLFDTAEEHFLQNDVYAPSIAELVGKMHLAHASVTTSSTIDGALHVEIDTSAVAVEHRAQLAGMGLRIHQAHAPIRSVTIDSLNHPGYTGDTVMLPSAAGPTQTMVIEFGATPADVLRLPYVSKPVTALTNIGTGLVATLSQPGAATQFCFESPDQSVVLRVAAYTRAGSRLCGRLDNGHQQPTLEIEPLDTGFHNAFVRAVDRPIATAAFAGHVLSFTILPGSSGTIDLNADHAPDSIVVDGSSHPVSFDQGAFSVAIPAAGTGLSVDVSFPACVDGVGDCLPDLPDAGPSDAGPPDAAPPDASLVPGAADASGTAGADGAPGAAGDLDAGATCAADGTCPDSGCGCRTGPGRPGWLAIFVVVVVLRRRRRHQPMSRSRRRDRC